MMRWTRETILAERVITLSKHTGEGEEDIIDNMGMSDILLNQDIVMEGGDVRYITKLRYSGGRGTMSCSTYSMEAL